MKNKITSSVKLIFSDKYLMFLSLFFILLSVAFMTYVVVGVNPSELQLVTHYTAFGVTQLYRSHWWYLLSFAIFGAILIFFYIAIALKIFDIKGRDLAIAYLWLGVGIVVFAWITSFSIINVWSPV